MAQDYPSTQVEVAGQIICELIKKDILPQELRTREGISAGKLAGIMGRMYQIIWQDIYAAPTAAKEQPK